MSSLCCRRAVRRLPVLPSQLTSLNVGCNQLTRLDACLATLWRLESLHLFQNRITQLNARVLSELSALGVKRG